MSIVKMKRMQLVGLMSEKEQMLHRLMLNGAVEISELGGRLGETEWLSIVKKNDSHLSEYKKSHAKLASALSVLDKYCPEKTGLFPKRREVSDNELFEDGVLSHTSAIADEINYLENCITHHYAEANKLSGERLALEPWESLDIPLDTEGTRSAEVVFGSVPGSVDFEEMETELYSSAVQSQLILAGSNREQHCFMLICHKSMLEYAVNILRMYGFTRPSFAGCKGTAAQSIAAITKENNNIQDEIDRFKAEIARLSDGRENIKLCIDRLSQEITKAVAAERLICSDSVFALEGYVPAPDEPGLRGVLEEFTCAYELSEPLPEEADEVPVKLKNNKLTEPLMMVTEMYGLPAYDGIDPNPLIMPFFTVFFGIMYADLGYGLVLILLSLFVRKKAKLRGTVKYMFSLMTMCGITAAAFGLVTGGFFGNAISTVAGLLGKEVPALPGVLNYLIEPLLDPLSDPLTLLIYALVLGGVHIIAGMAIKAYMLIREGHILDAIFDVGSWWLVFAGIAVLATGNGYWVLVAGVAALVLTQGRSKPTIIGKLVGGISSLYDITAYFGDVLSYSRLMTLLLASSVIASIFNMLGALTGSIIAFAFIFLIGHAFNMGINIIGTYVHAARLQYLEYFGKFYKEGGRPFAPLRINTKYVDVIKEEI